MDFLVSNNFSSPIIKNPLGFSILWDFFHLRDISFTLAFFFIPLLTESLIYIQNSNIFKEMVQTFSVLVKKLSNIHVNVHLAGFQLRMFMR